jgi:hypothetical protein
MKKFVCAVLLLTVACGVYATETRLASLGIANWMIENDDNLIWLNPARITRHNKQVWGELGTSAGMNQWGGVSVACPLFDKNTLAAFFSRPYTGRTGSAGTNASGSDVTAIPNTIQGNSFTALTPCNKFDIIYGIPMGDMQLGFLLNSASYGMSEEANNRTSPAAIGDSTAKDEKSSSDLNFVFGAAMAKVQFFEKVDLAFTYSMPSAKNSSVGTYYNGTNWVTSDDRKLETSGGMNIGLNIRGIRPYKKSQLIAYFAWAMNDLSNTYTQKTDSNYDGDYSDFGTDTNRKQTRTDTKSTLKLGAALNTNLSEKTLLITALHFSQTVSQLDARTEYFFPTRSGTSEMYNYKMTSMDFPFNVAIEYQLSKPVVTRFGLSRAIFQSYTTDVNDPNYTWNGTAYANTSTSDSKYYADTQAAGSTSVCFGVGLDLIKNLTIDAVVRQQVLFSGTYIISGVANTLVGQLSAVYRFE